ncbi:MAG: ABC transporter ATP-binding protein, partial [Caldiserica bacterium]
DIFDYLPIERASKVSIVFQDPYSSLNPKLSIEYQINEVLGIRKKIDKDFKFEIEKPDKLLDFVKVSSRVLSSKPYQLSGGELQRVIIARAIALEPDYLLLDEPTSSLDVSIQSQIIYLLQELKNLTGMGMLFISHDINLVDCISDKVVLMKNGRIVEDEDYFKKLLNSTISLT